MTKRPFTQTTMKSENLISDEMKQLIISYMEACNAGEYAKSEGLLQKIKEQGEIDHGSHD
jgi:hypothetical protein